MVLPQKEKLLSKLQQQYPENPIEAQKAWTEMIHRYAAATLGFCIIFLLFLRIIRVLKVSGTLALLLFLLLLLQACLGMWTVTLRLWPLVVVGHLLGGMLIWTLLCVMRAQCAYPGLRQAHFAQWMIRLGFLIVLLQIALGAWVSANYAGTACIGFPSCNGRWVFPLHMREAFGFLPSIGENYQGGLLSQAARMTIQWVHRLGALVCTVYISALSLYLLKKASFTPIRIIAILLLLLLFLQITLGVINVVYLLPWVAALAHQAVAAFLLASMALLWYFSQGEPSHV
jgi:cytochrome c oxidase assembly protein subunit 15